MKKRILMSALMLAALTANADSCADSCDSCANSCFDGFYGGLSAGVSLNVSHQQVDADTATNLFGVVLFAEQSYHVNTIALGDTAAKGALYFGYGNVWENFYYLSAELFADLSHYSSKTSGDNIYIIPPPSLPPSSDELNISNSTVSDLSSVQYGIDLRPGVLISRDTLLYARIGVANAHLKLESTTGAEDLILAGASSALPLSASKSVTALRLGAGVEYRFYRCLGLRFDYIFTNYGSLSVEGSTTTIGSFGIFNFSTQSDASAKVTDHTVMLGLSYYF
jgi:opacity protein-like surface antigen